MCLRSRVDSRNNYTHIKYLQFNTTQPSVIENHCSETTPIDSLDEAPYVLCLTGASEAR